jgi:heat shock protein HslJ
MRPSVSPTRPTGLGRAGALSLLAAAALVFAACAGAGSSPSAAPDGPAAPFEGTDWRLVEYVGQAGGVVSVPATVEVTATFDAGTVAGNGGCNAYRGQYTVDGTAIEIGQLAATAMACTGAAAPVESAYLQILPLMTSFAVTGSRLELANESGSILLRFEVVEASDLGGTKWVATGINNGTGGVASVTGEPEVTAIFGGGGTVAGNGGCNQFSGPYTIDDGAIEIGPLVATKMACPALDQESAYFAALEAATTWSIRADQLELRDAAGALQVSFAAGASLP